LAVPEARHDRQPQDAISPWRWYVDKAILINGLAGEFILPFLAALIGFPIGWLIFLRRGLQNP
jgi:hypothetical protein